MPPVPRRASRVVLLAPDSSFLLIKARSLEGPDQPGWWHVPGGGLDPGETPSQAARREVAEEVGLTLADVGPRRATRISEFTIEGRPYVQYESFFLVRVPARVDVDPAGWTDEEKSSTLAWRWWTRDELRTTTDAVYPVKLGGWLDAWTTPETAAPRRWLAAVRTAASTLGHWSRWRAATFGVALRLPSRPRLPRLLR